ncbi:MAG: radical SAM protein [Bacteroidota bacterium]|nr:radical SAM protein [Bacteroidota bacterium]
MAFYETQVQNYFLLPRPGKENKGTEFLYSPLSLAYLSSHTPDYYRKELYDEYVGEDIDPYAIEADIVAMSPLTSGVKRAYRVADILRERGITCVVGGAHASAIPEEALEHFDAVVIGEGEKPWENFLEDFENDNINKTYFGRMDVELDGLGVPDRNMVHPNYHYPSINTSRGCPYSCSFCYLTVYNNRRYRAIPHETVLQDMETMRGEALLVVTDENFIGYSRQDHADRKELLKRMIKRNFDFNWGCQASLNIAEDPELMDLMYESGCRAVFIGFESSNPRDLKEIRKNHNANIDYKRIVEKIHSHKLAVIASCILGLDNQDKNYHKQLIRDLRNMKVDYVRVFLMTSWPGTPLNEKLEKEGRLIEDWDRTRKDIPNIHYKNYTHREILAARKEVMDSFFNFSSVLRTIIRWLFIDRSLMSLFIKMSFRNRISEPIRNKRALKFILKKSHVAGKKLNKEVEAMAPTGTGL